MDKDQVNKKFAEDLVIIHIETSLGLNLAANLRSLDKSLLNVKKDQEENQHDRRVLDISMYVEVALLRAKVEILEAEKAKVHPFNFISEN